MKKRWIQSDDGDQVAEVEANLVFIQIANTSLECLLASGSNTTLYYCTGQHIQIQNVEHFIKQHQTQQNHNQIGYCFHIWFSYQTQTVYKHMHTHTHNQYNSTHIRRSKKQQHKFDTFTFVSIISLFYHLFLLIGFTRFVYLL